MQIYFAPEALLRCMFPGGYCIFIEERKQDTGDTSYLSQNRRRCHPCPGLFSVRALVGLTAFFLCDVSCMQPHISLGLKFKVHCDEDSSCADHAGRVHLLPITSILTRYITRRYYTKEISLHTTNSTGADFPFFLKNTQNIQP